MQICTKLLEYVRIFKPPILNALTMNYIHMIYWTNMYIIYLPTLLSDYSDEDILASVETPIIPPSFPCHLHSVETEYSGCNESRKKAYMDTKHPMATFLTP